MSDNPPTTEVDLSPEKVPEKIEEDNKLPGPMLHCGNCDTEVVHKLAEMFLPGLACACVDNTTGYPFSTPGSVAVNFRKEMIDYITQRSESFVAESVILEGDPQGEVLDHPFDIVSYFVDEFVISKRNLVSQVSGWVLSDWREDKVDDFIQEMEMNGFWSLDRRETIAKSLLKNVDFKNAYHCDESFNSQEELDNHIDVCNFRTAFCQNEGCDAMFCTAHFEQHDSICPFKIIPCEQKCSDSIMRRDMDRHCITVCPMKIVNCPFYGVGCRAAVSQCMIEKHCSDDVKSHLMHVLTGIHREATAEDISRRVEKVLQASSGTRLAEARDMRMFKSIVKNLEAKLGPMQVTPKENEDSQESNTGTKAIEQSTQ